MSQSREEYLAEVRATMMLWNSRAVYAAYLKRQEAKDKQPNVAAPLRAVA